ncbi:hypothetical protein AAH718_001382 [Campylobacter coli]|nr:hypothetical protein [Campylobacter coli]EKS1384707.1 hypothetical protein [Campylobacter coli]ELJ4905020.1 hypothetical protein [Campylobacter coli]ELJ6582075.1 hypothetical protein [Campylobacter coli]ELJ6594261.1 hypothetical protein [Campylobacter coli]
MPTNKQIGEKIFDKCTEIYEILNNDKEAEAKDVGGKIKFPFGKIKLP